MIQGQIRARQVAASGVFSVISGHELSRRHWPRRGQAAARCGPTWVVAVFIVTAFCGRNAQNFCLYFLGSVGRATGHQRGTGGGVRWGGAWLGLGLNVPMIRTADVKYLLLIPSPFLPPLPHASNVHDAFASRCPNATVRVKYELTPLLLSPPPSTPAPNHRPVIASPPRQLRVVYVSGSTPAFSSDSAFSVVHHFVLGWPLRRCSAARAGVRQDWQTARKAAKKVSSWVIIDFLGTYVYKNIHSIYNI